MIHPTLFVLAHASSGGVELGVQFSSDVGGYIAGVQAYMGADTGELWDASGNLLATATFTDESQSGWQQVDFSSPVLIAGFAGTDWFTYQCTDANGDVSMYGTVYLDVLPAPTYDVSTPDYIPLQPNGTVSVSLTGGDPNRKAQWTSSDPSILQVGNNQLTRNQTLQPLKPGVVTLTITVFGIAQPIIKKATETVSATEKGYGKGVSHRCQNALQNNNLREQHKTIRSCAMGRPKRVAAGGIVYHVLNRANRRARMFHKPADYDAFLRIVSQGLERINCRVLGLCIMPNHWHLVLWPHRDGDLSRLVGWITNTHVKRYRQHYHDKVGGHLYQGRFRSFPVQEDGHLLTVLRYVEANPLRCGLSEQAGQWPWSSCFLRRCGTKTAVPLSDWPVPRPADWDRLVESRWEDEELKAMRTSVERGSPYGDDAWTRQTATALGLHATLCPPGRPKKQAI